MTRADMQGRGPRRLTLLAVGMVLLIVAGAAVAIHARSTRSRALSRSPAHAAGVGAASTTSPAAGPTAAPSNTDRVAEILGQMARLGFNPSAPAVAKHATAPPGGLYINWIGTWDGKTDSAANTNIKTTGDSDASSGGSIRHDSLTDLVYLRNLAAYAQRHPGDQRFAAEQARMGPIVRAEFTGYGTYRCWIYGQLTDLDQFLPDKGWGALAQQFITKVAANYIDGTTGAIIDPEHSDYRVDWAADCAGAMADAGRRFHRPALVTAAARAAGYLLAYARNPATGFFPLRISHRAGAHEKILDPFVKVGAEAQLLDGLLAVYDVTHDQALLTAVRDAVTSLWNPRIGVHDAVHGGFFFGVDVDGLGLRPQYKESRQALVLPLLEHLASDGVNERSRIEEMRHVVRDLLWQPALHGYLYRVSPSFAPYTNHVNGGAVTENWVTSEAMGIAAEALLDYTPYHR